LKEGGVIVAWYIKTIPVTGFKGGGDTFLGQFVTYDLVLFRGKES